MSPTRHHSNDVARMLALAFTEPPTAAWVVPDPTEREQAVAGQCAIPTDHARTAVPVGGER